MKLVYVALVGAFVGLAGCGPDQEPETTVDWGAFDAQNEAKAATVAATPVAAGGGDIGALLNAERAAAGLPALTVSAQLTAAARVHLDDMNRNGFFSHTGSDNSKPSGRLRAQGYGFCFVAENISQGYPSAEATMAGWMASPGHRANNLSAKATEYGVATGGRNTVLVFGTPGC